MAAKKPPQLGLPTTTPIAFLLEGEVYLERMNVLSEEGAGILSETLPGEGDVISVAFRLSTSKEAVRCKAKVVGLLPTTPAGIRLKEKMGDKAMPAITRAGMSDSATAIFRMEDLEAARAAALAKKEVAPGGEERELATGFSVVFGKLSPKAKSVLSHHLATSRRLGENLRAQGQRLVSVAENDRRIGEAFTEGDLSKRALDW